MRLMYPLILRTLVFSFSLRRTVFCGIPSRVAAVMLLVLMLLLLFVVWCGVVEDSSAANARG